MRLLRTFLVLLLLSGCGSTQIPYAPDVVPGISREQAVKIIEQTFYEDYGKSRPVNVEVTDSYILLQDGIVSKGSSMASAIPIGGSALAIGSSTTVTKAMGQRIYFNSLGRTTIHQKVANSNRFTVLLRASDQSVLRYVHTRSLAQAEAFANAVEVLRKQGVPK